MSGERILGYLRTCMDRRFVLPTRGAFEQETGLGPTDYYHESYPGGVAVAETDPLGENLAYEHGVRIFGWGAHGDGCAGLPGVDDAGIMLRLEKYIEEKMLKFPGSKHYRIFVTEENIEITEV